MEDHGLALLSIIHDVYGHPIVPNSNTGAAGMQESGSSATPNALASSNSKAHARPRVKKGPGNQRCSACHGFGHNSKYFHFISGMLIYTWVL